MQTQRFQGHQIQMVQRGFEQSPNTYELNDDNICRPFHELVDDIQIRQSKIDQQKVRKHNSKSKKGEFILRGFNKLKDAGLLNFTIEQLSDRANFELWMEEHAEPYFMHICSTDSHHVSRGYGKDLMRVLSNWMKEHNVSKEAVGAFDKFRSSNIWQYLGDKALPTTQQRGQQERFYTPEQLMAIKDRIFDLATNPDATPLTLDYKKRGQLAVAGQGIIKALFAAYHLAKNITARSGELRWIRVGDIDFKEGTVTRFVTKPTAGNFGDGMVENLWPTTVEPLADYLSSRREKRFQLPDAPIFSDKIKDYWRGLCKDVLGDAWVKNMNLHFFSRNMGVITMLRAGASDAQIMAATGATLEVVSRYAASFNCQQTRDAGNDLRYEQTMKDGLLTPNADVIIADAELSVMMRALQINASLELSAITGIAQEAPAPALYVASYNDNGEIESKQVERRERDLNPRGKIPRDFQSRALPGYAISAYLRRGLLPV